MFLCLPSLANTFQSIGYARRKHRDPCRRVVSLVMSLRVDKIYDRRVAWDHQLSEFNSEPYLQLSYEATRAVSIFSMASRDYRLTLCIFFRLILL